MSEEAKPRRHRRWVVLLLIVAALGAAYFSKVYYSVWRQARIDEARQVDVIVVLGAAQYWGRPSPVLRARLDHALKLYRDGIAPRIITTGGVGEGAAFSESEVSREYLSQQGVPAEFVTVETEGKSTVQSALAVAEIMDRMELRTCVVVSDAYHISESSACSSRWESKFTVRRDDPNRSARGADIGSTPENPWVTFCGASASKSSLPFSPPDGRSTRKKPCFVIRDS